VQREISCLVHVSDFSFGLFGNGVGCWDAVGDEESFAGFLEDGGADDYV